MIDIAKQAGAVRELIKMFELRSKDAVDEAQQTLDYFGVDDAAVKSIREQMDREASTQPLVRLQKLSWVMGAHERLGVSSANHALAGDLVERIGRYIAAAARPAVEVLLQQPSFNLAPPGFHSQQQFGQVAAPPPPPQQQQQQQQQQQPPAAAAAYASANAQYDSDPDL